MKVTNPVYFESASDFRSWLERHHDVETELWVGYYRKSTNKPSMTWQESVGEALCFGWIDGIRKRVDAESYANRFTPRKKSSKWSAVNTRRMEELIAMGRVHPAALERFEQRPDQSDAHYSYEQWADGELPEEFENEFRASASAWTFFTAEAPWYRRSAIRWVMSAKKEETRRKRLATLIDDSLNGRRIAPLRR